MMWKATLHCGSVFHIISTCLMFYLVSVIPAAASDSGRQLQLRWGELAPKITGKRVSIPLSERKRIEGKVISVEAGALVIDIKKTSDRKNYPRGRMSVPRNLVTSLRLIEYKSGWRFLLPALAPFLVGYLATKAGFQDEDILSRGQYTAGLFGIVVGSPILAYYIGRAIDCRVTNITIVPEPETAGAYIPLEASGRDQEREGPRHQSVRPSGNGS